MKKYDYIFSLGESCSCAQSLKENNLRRYSGPFDWVWGASLGNRIELILNDFKDFTKKELFEPINDKTSTNQIYRNTLTDIKFNHDFPKGADFNNIYPIFEKKYNRRIKRFLKILKSGKKILLVYLQCPDLKNHNFCQNNKITDIKEASLRISSKYINVDLLYINHNENLKNGEINISQIINNLYYAECFNYNKDDILPANNTNYENIAKILANFKINHKLFNTFMRKLKNISFLFYKDKTNYVRVLFFKFYKK